MFLTMLFIRKKNFGRQSFCGFLQEIMTIFFGILQFLAVLCICFIFVVFSPESFHIASLGIYAIIALALLLLFHFCYPVFSVS